MEKHGKNRRGAGDGCRGLSLGILGFYVLIRYLSGHVEDSWMFKSGVQSLPAL